MSTLPRACALVLCFVSVSFPVAAEKAGETIESEPLELAPPGGGSETKRTTLSSEGMDALRRRLALTEEIQDAEESIAALEQLIADLQGRRKHTASELDAVEARLRSVENEIDETEGDLDANQAAITVSAVASAGVASPELVAIRERLKGKLRELHAQRDSLRSQRSALQREIADIDTLIERSQQLLAAKRQELLGAKSRLTALSIIAPSEHARLRTGTEAELRIRCSQPPAQLRIEIQEQQGGGWSTIHDASHAWKPLQTSAPDVASLRFKLGESTTGRTVHKPNTLPLGKGRYRARVSPVGTSGGGGMGAGGPHGAGHDGALGDQSPRDEAAPGQGPPGDGTGQPRSPAAGTANESSKRTGSDASMQRPTPWRSFEVVGRVGSDAIQRTPKVEIQPGQTSPGKEVQTIRRPPSGIAPKPPGGIQSPTGGD